MRLLKFNHIYSEITPSVVQTIRLSEPGNADIQFQVKRDDLLHSVISGNKWRKLKYLLQDIEGKGYRQIVAMGGAYSNLLHSLAYICRRLGWDLKMLVRGYPEQPLTPMLSDAISWGASVEFIDRNGFRCLRESPPELAEKQYWINEGAFHAESFKGSQETFFEFSELPDYLVMATATGASLAGLAMGASQIDKPVKIIGVSVLNNAEQVRKDLDKILPKHVARPQLIEGFEFGGYAKSTQELDDFIRAFEVDSGIALEKVYSGKSFFATVALLKQDFFNQGSRVCVIHCGGMQGKRPNS